MILYIEDDTENQRFMKDLVAQFIPNVELVVCGSTGEAIRAYADLVLELGGTFSLIIVDGDVGGTHGWNIITTLKGYGIKLPPVLAFVGDLSNISREHWNRAGVTEIIQKPGDLKVLVATITRLLAQGGAS
jgi:CheY-like chemotaxis protein